MRYRTRMTANRRTIPGLAMLLIAVSLMHGCASPRQTGGKASAVALYEMGRYDDAYRAAIREEGRSSGKVRQRAALTAGLAAHAIGRDAEASRWLRPLARSNDPKVAGRAEATLGLVAMADSDHPRAATLLASAGRKLTGEASARANYHAAEAYTLSGRPDTARLHMRLALAQSTDDDFKNTIRRQLGEFEYTVQIGAYSALQNAERAAEGVRSSATRLGLGDPRIVEHRTAAGSTLFLVHIGKFVTRDEAKSARVRLGRQGVVTSLKR